MSSCIVDVLTPLQYVGKPVGFVTEQAVDTLSVDESVDVELLARSRSPSEEELASLKMLCESVAASAQKLGELVATVKVLTTHGIAVSQPVSISISSRSSQASSCSLMVHLSMLPEHWYFQAIFWTSDSTRGSGSDRASIESRLSVPPWGIEHNYRFPTISDFSDAVKQLNTALMAYPCSNGWDKCCRHSGLSGRNGCPVSTFQLISKLERFVDDTSDAIGSSMFSPAGIWASPRAPTFLPRQFASFSQAFTRLVTSIVTAAERIVQSLAWKRKRPTISYWAKQIGSATKTTRRQLAMSHSTSSKESSAF